MFVRPSCVEITYANVCRARGGGSHGRRARSMSTVLLNSIENLLAGATVVGVVMRTDTRHERAKVAVLVSGESCGWGVRARTAAVLLFAARTTQEPPALSQESDLLVGYLLLCGLSHARSLRERKKEDGDTKASITETFTTNNRQGKRTNERTPFFETASL